jgi:hypothetical protein
LRVGIHTLTGEIVKVNFSSVRRLLDRRVGRHFNELKLSLFKLRQIDDSVGVGSKAQLAIVHHPTATPEIPPVERTINLYLLEGRFKMADNFECPKCNKKTLVQYKEHHYECLACDFKKVPLPPQPRPKNGLFWASLLALVTMLLFLQTRDNTPVTQTQVELQPSPISQVVGSQEVN